MQNLLRKGGNMMKSMTKTAMMQANGGLASAKCPFCGKKFTGLFIALARYQNHLNWELKLRK